MNQRRLRLVGLGCAVIATVLSVILFGMADDTTGRVLYGLAAAFSVAWVVSGWLTWKREPPS